MESRRSIQVSGGGDFPYDRFQGISTSLKVAALAAGYAAFVWLTMFQLERGNLARHEASTKTESGAQSKSGKMPEQVDIRSAAQRSAVVRPDSEPSPAPFPGDERTGAGKVDNS